MKNTYEQLNIEYTETREVSLQIKIVTIFLALIFALIPLAELVYEFDYNYIKSEVGFQECIVGEEYRTNEVLKFEELIYFE